MTAQPGDTELQAGKRRHRTVIIHGVRDRSDLRQEYPLAAMNEALGITTLLLPAQPGLGS